MLPCHLLSFQTYIFDIWAWVDSDNVAVLHTEIVSDHTVDTGTTIIEVIVGKDNQNGILSLLSLDQDCVTTEELQSLHGVIGQSNNRVVIVNGIGDTRARD
jgi:hypothetical protein